MKRKHKHLQSQRKIAAQKKAMKAKKAKKKEYVREPLEGAPFSLFQAEDGRWGVKDKDGNVTEYPDMIRHDHEDGIPTLYDGQTSICGFSEDECFYIIAWHAPDTA